MACKSRVNMQDRRLYLHTDMLSSPTEQQPDTFQDHFTSIQQQCVLSTVEDLHHQGQMEGLLQLGEQPDRLQLLSPQSLLQGLNQQVGTEGKDLQVSSCQENLVCSGCLDFANMEQEDSQGELQSKLSRLHLEDKNDHFMRIQGPRERELYQPFPQHDTKHHFTDIRYPEPLATEESPRRRARSLPWNSIPEEDEEDSIMCCCKLKKKVQFADSLGLSLASVKHFLPSDEPLVPQAVLARLQSYPPSVRAQRPELILEDEFISTEMAASETTPVELLERLAEQGVCLEHVSASRLGVIGYVLVKEPGEKAQVKIRYTFNEWRSFLDCPATLAGQNTALLANSECQRFHFNLCYPPSTSSIHFAICYSTGHGQEIWDNNNGGNYTVSCQQDVIPEIQSSSPEQEEWEGSYLW